MSPGGFAVAFSLLVGCSTTANPEYGKYPARDAWAKVESDGQVREFFGPIINVNGRPFMEDATDSLRENAGKKLSQEAAMAFGEKILARCESEALANVQGGAKALVLGRFTGKRNEQRLDMDLVNREFRYQLSNHPTLKDKFRLVTTDAEDREALIRKINGSGDPNSMIDPSLAQVVPANTYLLTGEWYSEEEFPKGSWASQPPTFRVTAYLTLRSLTQPSGEGDVRETQVWIYHPVLKWITEEEDARLDELDPSSRPANSPLIHITQPLRTLRDDLRSNEGTSGLCLTRRTLANHLDAWIDAVERGASGDGGAVRELDDAIYRLARPIDELVPGAKELADADLERLRNDSARILECLSVAREDIGR